MRTYVWLVVAMVAIVTVAAEPNADLLKRLVNALEVKDAEKRSMQLMKYDAGTGNLKIQFQVCVQGDRSKQPCRPGIQGHYWEIVELNKDGSVSMIKSGKTTKYMVVDPTLGGQGFSEVINANFDPKKRYRVTACEAPKLGQGYDKCNMVEFVAGRSGTFFPTSAKARPSGGNNAV